MQLKYDKLTSRSASNSFWLIYYNLNKHTHKHTQNRKQTINYKTNKQYEKYVYCE